ncbi:DUF2306 domain-containing protein [Nonomuraea sp. KC401]|uniref:DUF2306 domain-containing protein n=1 Tax=unclassified Nonomuraea TaxID=2593643 RepID=UPI0010FCF6BE|nr:MULTISPECIES: DUF2306 domain-containing protein [unclassified Nonomuraea]NBE99866.1 DUF2306 domain-containing protein [Nonomuraea sp. K271]TLF47368.1 DUF2306 domain-containing protein [Nonomuraea sp. KC401]
MTHESTPLPGSGRSGSAWAPRTGLIVLGCVPILAGAVRLTELNGGAGPTPDNARFLAAPLPVTLHIVGASLYTLLGAFQFGGRWRPRHRVMGRALVPLGLVAALSGLWLTLFSALPPGDGGLLAAFRLGFGTAMAGSLVLGVAAVLRRDVPRHRAWMARAYALGLGAGSQAVTQALWLLFAATPPDEAGRALLLGAGWAVNLAVAEWVIRWRWAGRPVRV